VLDKPTYEELEQTIAELRDTLKNLTASHAQLQQAEFSYKTFVQNAVIGIYRADEEGRLLMANRKIAEMFAYAYTPGSPSIHDVRQFYAEPALRDILIEEIKGTGFFKCKEVALKKRDGMPIWVEIQARTITTQDGKMIYEGVVQDITERKQAERLKAQLIQSQKMEAIGQLAGGIAHDFNNILGAILGYAQLAQLNTIDNPGLRKHIDQICVAGERARKLVHQILAFSSQVKTEKMPIDLRPIIVEALKMIRPLIPSNIAIRHDIRAASGTVIADQTQIHQVIINLCTNAYHAMKAEGGVLCLGLDTICISTPEMSYSEHVPCGRYLRMTVSDTGRGMDEQTLSRIFDPYFTTKEIGEGTGIGLATVHGIVQEHGGVIQVNSAPNQGTTFKLFFPLAESSAHPTPSPQMALPCGTESILLVDDETSLLEIGRELLEKLGYAVETHLHPLEAAAVFRKQPEKYDLVITDMTMPHMTGDRFAQTVKAIRPDIPVMLCTGFGYKVPSQALEKGYFKRVLMKPLTLADLAVTVRALLDEVRDLHHH